MMCADDKPAKPSYTAENLLDDDARQLRLHPGPEGEGEEDHPGSAHLPRRRIEENDDAEGLAQRHHRRPGELRPQAVPGGHDAIAAISEDSLKALKEVLSPEQHRRYEELTLQGYGVNGMLLPRAAGKLQLTDKQKYEIEMIHENVIKDVQKAVGKAFKKAKGDFVAAQEFVEDDLKKIQNESKHKGYELLNADQKKIWSGLIGKPFKKTE